MLETIELIGAFLLILGLICLKWYYESKTVYNVYHTFDENGVETIEVKVTYGE